MAHRGPGGPKRGPTRLNVNVWNDKKNATAGTIVVGVRTANNADYSPTLVPL